MYSFVNTKYIIGMKYIAIPHCHRSTYPSCIMSHKKTAQPELCHHNLHPPPCYEAIRVGWCRHESTCLWWNLMSRQDKIFLPYSLWCISDKMWWVFKIGWIARNLETSDCVRYLHTSDASTICESYAKQYSKECNLLLKKGIFQLERYHNLIVYIKHK